MDIKEILLKHKNWLLGDTDNGKKADLRDADLMDADLRYANLRRANLRRAELRGAELRGAELDSFYENIPATIGEVAKAILNNPSRLDMGNWHGDEFWRNGTAKPVNECGTAHCIAGWAHHLAALKRPELLDPKVNVYLVGLKALGEEAASHFYDNNEAALKWLKEKVAAPKNNT